MRSILLQIRGWLQDEAWAIRQGVKTWRTARGYIAFCQQEAEDHYAQEDAEAHCPADDERIGTNRKMANVEVVDACEETGRYAVQTSDGYCYGCGKHH